jgi:putative salt-induced outer membrane protein YdiY
MKIVIVAVTLALVAGAVTDVATASPKSCTAGKCAKKRAKKLLANRVFIKFTQTTGNTNSTSLDQRLHLCGDATWVYDSISYIEATGTTSQQRYTGTWKVKHARLSRNGKRGTVRVRGESDQGGPATTVKISWRNGSARLDGDEVIVDQSDLC